MRNRQFDLHPDNTIILSDILNYTHSTGFGLLTLIPKKRHRNRVPVPFSSLVMFRNPSRSPCLAQKGIHGDPESVSASYCRLRTECLQHRIAQGLLVAPVHRLPIDDVPDGTQIIPSFVLVFEVIGMFPDIDA
ncbi:MAG: hypothetical protein RLY31_949 [Bacteroidota bacterium]